MIFYFSGTGNTKWAAKHVAARLNEELKFIPDELSTDMTYTVNPGESIGFIIPVHGWRPPLLVRRFLSQCQFIHTDKVYTYIIYTAGDSIGKAVEIFENDLKHHGLTVDAALSLIMPESYVGLPFMDVDKVEKEKAKKEGLPVEESKPSIYANRQTEIKINTEVLRQLGLASGDEEE